MLRLANPRRDQHLLGESAVRCHAGETHRDAEMRDHHAPGEERRAAQVALPQGRNAGRRQPSRQGQPEQRQDADAAAKHEEQHQGDRRQCSRDHHARHYRAGTVAAPAQQRPRAHDRDEDQRDRPGGLVEERRADRQLHAECRGDDRVERPDQHDAEHDTQEQVVGDQRAFTTDRFEGVAGADSADAGGE